MRVANRPHAAPATPTGQLFSTRSNPRAADPGFTPTRGHRRACGFLAVAFALCACAASAQTADSHRFAVAVELAAIGQQRNDVRIPPQSGTAFSLVDLAGSAAAPAIRVELTTALTERQDLRLVYAPLRLTGQGTPAQPIAFAGAAFMPLRTDAEYKFSSYRATWRYRVYQGPRWSWRVGFTGFVRDARIALSQPGSSAEDTDVGFVPLGHVAANARIAERWRLDLVADAAAAPQGRAVDFAATVGYRPRPQWTVFAGYRTIEGGADVEAVYTFAWLNAIVGGLAVGF
jgi:hypothetical protein